MNIEQIRKDFEEWARPSGFNLTLDTRSFAQGDYISRDTYIAWLGWQAAYAKAMADTATIHMMADSYVASLRGVAP